MRKQTDIKTKGAYSLIYLLLVFSTLCLTSWLTWTCAELRELVGCVPVAPVLTLDEVRRPLSFVRDFVDFALRETLRTCEHTDICRCVRPLHNQRCKSALNLTANKYEREVQYL